MHDKIVIDKMLRYTAKVCEYCKALCHWRRGMLYCPKMRGGILPPPEEKERAHGEAA